MITTKQRAFLGTQAMTLSATIQIGRDGLLPEITQMVDDALEAKELVKLNVQRNCFTPVKELAGILAERTHSDVVQVVGRKITLYRYSRTVKHHVPLAKETD